MSYWHFTPPNTTPLSTWSAEASPLANRLMAHFEANVQVNNVWIWSDGTVSESQPPFLNNADGDIGTSVPYAARVFYGSHTYSDVTDAEKALLQGAGYVVT